MSLLIDILGKPVPIQLPDVATWAADAVRDAVSWLARDEIGIDPLAVAGVTFGPVNDFGVTRSNRVRVRLWLARKAASSVDDACHRDCYLDFSRSGDDATDSHSRSWRFNVDVLDYGVGSYDYWRYGSERDGSALLTALAAEFPTLPLRVGNCSVNTYKDNGSLGPWIRFDVPRGLRLPWRAIFDRSIALVREIEAAHPWKEGDT